LASQFIGQKNAESVARRRSGEIAHARPRMA
jgi:hypothetical protein